MVKDAVPVVERCQMAPTKEIEKKAIRQATPSEVQIDALGC